MLQPMAAGMCYPDVCMDDLTARLARDLDGTFAELMATHQDLVFGVALRVVGDRATADDVAQEAFVRAYRALKGYPAARIRELRLRPWLARISLNLARNDRRARRPTDTLDDADSTHSQPGDGPVRLVERREEHRFWSGLLNQLPERYRLAVALRHVEGLSYSEIADALARPVGSVKSDVHRGVRELRAAYEAEQRLIAQREAV
jgi:RNA polymerase sigma-70 factor (ECF subfamily)